MGHPYEILPPVDTERGKHVYRIRERGEEGEKEMQVAVAKWCKIERRLGRDVYEARNEQTGRKVEIKVVPVRTVGECEKAIRELEILQVLGRHENIHYVRNVVMDKRLGNISVVMPSFQTDLTQAMKNSLSESHRKYIMYQITRGLFYAHSAGVFHGDLNPSSVRINSRCDVALTSFHNRTVPRDPVLTCWWYLAPESCLLAPTSFSCDLWALGCIFGLLLTKKPLYPGCGSKDQLSRILAKPSHTIPVSSRIDAHLLNGLLQLEPGKRLHPDAVLSHPYLGELHCPEEEPLCKLVWTEPHVVSAADTADSLHSRLSDLCCQF
eukprot:TRINITY_DN3518_c2_g1_i1.p1 TRINITY_DN3518_c2_g1~~TRINITY_DN3518_c2_g1_i1.p1  ORF type:complete len:342 (+),score=32.90 TRINITY_DN3518_c2_g1_i1:60-1028(+)